MSKCTGCGVELQNNSKTIIGYTNNLSNDLCERCFRIRNYNDYKFVSKDNSDYIQILKEIGKTNDLVILVVDLFNISYQIQDISKYINNNILLVLTKKDIIPKSCNEEKLINYFNKYNLKIIDTVVISSNKNYNLDLLFDRINNYKTSNNVYVVGFTNSGKSTLINKILYNYSNNKTVITTSNLPSTTIDSIEVKVCDDLNLIDTPGLLDSKDISNYIDGKTLKKIIPSKEIKPITYQIKERQNILIDDLCVLDVLNKSNLTIYMSNKLNIKRSYKNNIDLKDLSMNKIHILANKDLVIQGLGFIKFSTNTDIILYVKNGVGVFVRDSLI